MQMKHQTSTQDWVSAADQLAHDISRKMQSVGEQMESARDRSHPRQTNPRRVARIMSEGEIDKAEQNFESDQSEQSREDLIGTYDKVTGDPTFQAAMTHKRADSEAAIGEHRDLASEHDELGRMNDLVARNRFDMMSVKQAGLENFRSSRPVEDAMPEPGGGPVDVPEHPAMIAGGPGPDAFPQNEGGGRRGLGDAVHGHQETEDGKVVTPGNFDPNDSSLKNEGLALMGMGDERMAPGADDLSLDKLRGRSNALSEARNEAWGEAKSDPTISLNLSQLRGPMDLGMSAAGPRMDRGSEV